MHNPIPKREDVVALAKPSLRGSVIMGERRFLQIGCPYGTKNLAKPLSLAMVYRRQRPHPVRLQNRGRRTGLAEESVHKLLARNPPR